MKRLHSTCTVLAAVLVFLLLAACAALPPDAPQTAGRQAAPAAAAASKPAPAESAAFESEPAEAAPAWMPGLAEAGQALEPYSVYLVGEGHANTKTYDVELALIRYFYLNHGVRTVMLEDGYCSAQLLNEYLRTGDGAILDVLMEGNEGSPAHNTGTVAFYQGLRAFYDTLPENDRFTLCGIDLQMSYSTGRHYLQRFITEDTPEEIRAVTQTLWTEMVTSEKDALKKLAAIQERMEEEPEVFQEHFGARFADFAATVDSLAQSLRVSQQDYNAYMEYREQCLTDNFFSYYDGEEKCVAILGNWHTNLAGWPNGDPYPNIAQNIAAKIGTGSGGVASICCVYQNSFTFSGQEESVLDTDAGVALAERAGSDVEFFVLDAQDAADAVGQLAGESQFAVSIADSPAAAAYPG